MKYTCNSLYDQAINVSVQTSLKNMNRWCLRTVLLSPVVEGALVSFIIYIRTRHEVAQLVEARRYKPVGRGFDSMWCNGKFSLN
jgi:hypothetical protein